MQEIQASSLQVKTDYKAILGFALPIAMAILVPQINFIINNIFLGSLGEKQLALGGLTGIFYLIFAVLGQGINAGLQSLIARSAGENNTQSIASLYQTAIRMVLIFSLLCILFVWFFAPSILQWAMHDKANAQIAADFLRIRIMGLPFLYLFLMRNSLLVGVNQSRYLVIGTASEAVVNVFFDYALIYGKFGLPALGFNGAAVASIIAEFTAQAVAFWVIKQNKTLKQMPIFVAAQHSLSTAKIILVRSAPLVGQYALSIVSWEIFYLLIEHHGERALAVSNTMRNIFGFFGCFTWAFASTTNAMVSNVIGQKKLDDVFPMIYKILRLSMGFAAIVALLVNAFAPYIFAIYGQPASFIADAIPVLRVVSVALLLMSFSVVWLNSLIAVGKTTINLLIEFAAIILYLIYSYLTLEKWQMPIYVGWGSEWIYWICLFLPSYIFMRSGKWKQIVATK